MFSPRPVEKTCLTCPILPLLCQCVCVCVCVWATYLTGCCRKNIRTFIKTAKAQMKIRRVLFLRDESQRGFSLCVCVCVCVSQCSGDTRQDIETKSRLQLVLKPHTATKSNICRWLELSWRPDKKSLCSVVCTWCFKFVFPWSLITHIKRLLQPELLHEQRRWAKPPGNRNQNMATHS